MQKLGVFTFVLAGVVCVNVVELKQHKSKNNYAQRCTEKVIDRISIAVKYSILCHDIYDPVEYYAHSRAETITRVLENRLGPALLE